jgi:hypothetical protein
LDKGQGSAASAASTGLASGTGLASTLASRGGSVLASTGGVVEASAAGLDAGSSPTHAYPPNNAIPRATETMAPLIFLLLPGPDTRGAGGPESFEWRMALG